jgi:hypothetical protein
MELHMVHKSVEGHLAVIGVLFREGEPNAFISRVMLTAIAFTIPLQPFPETLCLFFAMSSYIFDRSWTRSIRSQTYKMERSASER